jgi:hypothetical protein
MGTPSVMVVEPIHRKPSGVPTINFEIPMFHAIKPIHQLSLAEIRALARAAADREDADSNPFPAGTDKHRDYQRFYHERCTQLCPA